MDDNSNNNSAKKPSPNKEAAAGAAVGVAKDPATTVKSVDQRQLREFNEWLARWINYQGLLAKYWKNRAQYEQQQRLTVSDEANNAVEGKASSKWDIRFQELCEYKNEHGNCNVPSGFVYKYKPPLGAWVKNMRRQKKAGKLSDDKVTRLSSIGFEFVKKASSDGETIAFSAPWHSSFMQLKAFKERHGNIEVPTGYLTPNNKKLDRWMNRQRRLFRENKLPVELIRKLEEVGLNLNGRGRPYGLDGWMEKYKELKDYWEKNGNCDVAEYGPNKALGAWCRRQRDLYKMEALSDDRFEKLTELGFDFTSGKDKKEVSPTLDSWATRVSELKAFKEANGHADVPGSYALNRGLGTWVHRTRVAYHEGELTDEQTEELKKLEFEFKLKTAKPRQARVWERNFAMLAEYKAQNSSFKGICAHNPAIGKWLKRQKYYYRENNLKEERIDRLRELGVAFEEARVRKTPVKLPWETHYEALVEYKNVHGDTNVPSVYPENQCLYHWINTQRASFRGGRLPEERIQKLTAIGFNFNAEEARIQKGKPKPSKGNGFLNPTEFDHYFQKLVEYKTSNGDVNVPQRYNQDRLGTFVHYMRLYHKTGKLSSDQISRLQEVGFNFDVQESLWNTRCEELAAYKEAHGDFFVPYATNPALHQWKNNQIRRYNQGNLPKEYTDKLLTIGFDFIKGPVKTSTPTKKLTPNKQEPPIGILFAQSQENRDQYLQNLWESNYQKLATIYEQRGNCDIPLKYEEDPSLGAWVFAQKLSKKKNKLSAERIEKLEMIHFKF